jgi:hypothetical protein
MPAKGVVEVTREAHRAEAGSLVDAHGGLQWPRSAFPNDRPVLELGWLEVECNRCKTKAASRSTPSASPAIRRCGSWRRRSNADHAAGALRSAGSHDPAKQAREITPYKWVHPNEDR